MRDKEKYIEEFLESRLRKSELKRTSGDFTGHLMKRITAENKALLEERKSDRIVKYAIGSFSFLMLAFTIGIGIISKRETNATSDASGIGFDTMQTSNSFIETVLIYIQRFFMGVLEFFGVSMSPGSVTIMLVVILVVAIFFIGERVLLRGKYRSSIQMK
jgi:hypothetical protein